MIRFLLSLLIFSSLHAAIPQASMDTYDFEAKAWRDQVRTNSGDVLGPSYRYATTFMQFVKRVNVRPKLVFVLTYQGTNLNAMRMPIIHDIANTGGPILNNNFVDGDFVETGAGAGLTGNGTSKSLVLQGAGSGTVSMSQIGQKAHLGVYVQTGANLSQHCIGQTEASGDSSAYVLPSHGTGNTFAQVNDTVSLQWSVADSAGTGLYIATRTAVDFAAVYKNGAQLSTQTGTVVGTHNSALVIAVHALNVDGVMQVWTTKTLSFATVGFELTAQQNLDYYRAVQRLQLNLTRGK